MEVQNVPKSQRKPKSNTIYQKYFRKNGNWIKLEKKGNMMKGGVSKTQLRDESLACDELGLGIKLPKHLMDINRFKSSAGTARTQTQVFQSNTTQRNTDVMTTSREQFVSLPPDNLSTQRFFPARIQSGINKP
jgi:hypothetical protein